MNIPTAKLMHAGLWCVRCRVRTLHGDVADEMPMNAGARSVSRGVGRTGGRACSCAPYTGCWSCDMHTCHPSVHAPTPPVNWCYRRSRVQVVGNKRVQHSDTSDGGSSKMGAWRPRLRAPLQCGPAARAAQRAPARAVPPRQAHARAIMTADGSPGAPQVLTQSRVAAIIRLGTVPGQQARSSQSRFKSRPHAEAMQPPGPAPRRGAAPRSQLRARRGTHARVLGRARGACAPGAARPPRGRARSVVVSRAGRPCLKAAARCGGGRGKAGAGGPPLPLPPPGATTPL